MIKQIISLLAAVVAPSLCFAQEGNISTASVPYVGWKLDAPYADPAKGKGQTIAPNTRMGRQIAASADFYSRDYCKRWYRDLNPVGVAYIDQAKKSDPKEFAAFQASIAKAVKRLAIDKSNDACILLTSPYQAGGDAAELMPWGREGFYVEHEE